MPTFNQSNTPPEYREALIQFAADFNPNYFLTGVFNRKSLKVWEAKRELKVFIRRMCEEFFGKHYMKHPLVKNFNGVVFVEYDKRFKLHFHIPVHIPCQIESKFVPYAEKQWEKMFQGGGLQCDPITSDIHFFRAVAYSAKDVLIPSNAEHWCTLCMLYQPKVESN